MSARLFRSLGPRRQRGFAGARWAGTMRYARPPRPKSARAKLLRWLGFLDRHEKAEKGCVRINLHLQSARTRNEDDALRFANATDYGLSSAVYCGDLERGVRFAQAVEAGMTCVNDTSLGDEAHAAFGGEKTPASDGLAASGLSMNSLPRTGFRCSIRREPIRSECWRRTTYVFQLTFHYP
ncbi:aldehyde dehydrogenase family protein [Methylobacter sp.]|uniref:aldehyde dehydrogenase family protein n=1 Tax=Methylobacter sp. TaxID=2051955 RepID=UPI003DA2B535